MPFSAAHRMLDTGHETAMTYQRVQGAAQAALVVGTGSSPLGSVFHSLRQHQSRCGDAPICLPNDRLVAMPSGTDARRVAGDRHQPSGPCLTEES